MLLALWQDWCHDHLPVEPVAVTDHPLSKETAEVFNYLSTNPSENLQEYEPELELRHPNLYKNSAGAVDFQLPLGERVSSQLLFHPTMCLVQGSTMTIE